jgi:hypothetical protein
MGWTFNYYGGKKELVAQLRDTSRFTAGTKLLQTRVIGNRHWYLAETNGKKWIGLDLMKGGMGSGWGYKSMDESAGPYYFDCPVTYLDKADVAPGPHAAAWREKVRSAHQYKTSLIVVDVGLVFDIRGESYTVTRKHPLRNGWIVTGINRENYCSTANIRAWVKYAKDVADAKVAA